MATVYLVTLHVNDKDLPVVLGAISGSAKLVSVTPTEEAKAEKPRNQHYVDNRRNKGIRGEDLILNTLQKEARAFTVKEIESRFVENRFSVNSVSPALNRLVTADKIRKVGTGSYCLKGTVLKFGAGS
jgi:hypothetical protein